MRIHAIMHAPFEILGAIEKWVKEKNHLLSETHTYLNQKLPDVAEFDLLVIMGGPQSPLEIKKFPYLQNEIELTKQVIKANKPIIGICLGAQIIAEALGAETTPSEFKEIGHYPIQLTKEGLEDPIFSHFDREFNVMHWHNDMPGLPTNAVLLAKSKGCSRQAFRYGDRIYGFQFHLEMTHELIKGMMEHCEADLAPGKYIRSREEMMLTDCTLTNEKMFKVLNYMEKFAVPESVNS